MEAWLDHGAHDAAVATLVLSVVVPVASGQSSGMAVDGVEVIEIAQSGQSLASAISEGIALATGSYIAILGASDRLEPNVAAALSAALETGADAVYTDERVHGSVFSKPSFSPERLRSQFYTGNLTAYRRELIEQVGGVREGVEGAELYDLALRALTAARRVEHVAEVLVTTGDALLASAWGTTDAAALASTRSVLEEHLAATGGGEVEAVSLAGANVTHRAVHGNPLVSIVIPTRGTSAVVNGVERNMVIEAVRGIVAKSTYTNFELVIVIDDVASDAVRDELVSLAGDRLRFVEWDQPFTFSGKMNLGVLHARGEFVMLLNDDVELITPRWLERMLALAQLPQSGLVGSMLYFDDDTIQHAGHAYYRLDVTHIGLHSQRGAAGPHDGFLVEREVAGVTAACAIMRRSVFLEAGGFSTLLPGNFNDVDLCMKVATLGYQSYWTPAAELYHFESKSRDPRVSRSEIDTAWGRWERLIWESPLWPTDPHEVFASDGR